MSTTHHSPSPDPPASASAPTVEVRATMDRLPPPAIGDLAPGAMHAPGVATATAELTAASNAEFFETIYREAHADPASIPWANRRPNPMMVSWLNAEAPGIVRPGSRVAVVGCGLGDDVAELASRGYDAIGFDVSPTAVEWARRRFPALSASFITADLLKLPPRLCRRFDLVVEIYTLQALPVPLREDAARCIASLAGSKGHVLTICRGRDESELLETFAGPPWPLTVSELTGLMEAAGLHPTQPVADFEDDETPPKRRLRAVFAR